MSIFLNPFTVCKSCRWKFIICLFVYEETNGSYPFANELIGLAQLPINAFEKIGITDTVSVFIEPIIKQMFIYPRYYESKTLISVRSLTENYKLKYNPISDETFQKNYGQKCVQGQ